MTSETNMSTGSHQQQQQEQQLSSTHQQNPQILQQPQHHEHQHQSQQIKTIYMPRDGTHIGLPDGMITSSGPTETEHLQPTATIPDNNIDLQQQHPQHHHHHHHHHPDQQSNDVHNQQHLQQPPQQQQQQQQQQDSKQEQSSLDSDNQQSNPTATRFKWTKEKSQVALNLAKHGCKPKLISVAVGCSLRTAQKFVETVSPEGPGGPYKDYQIRRRGRKSKDVNQRLDAIREVLSKDCNKTQVEIAADLKVSNTTVCRDLKRLGASWRDKKNANSDVV